MRSSAGWYAFGYHNITTGEHQGAIYNTNFFTVRMQLHRTASSWDYTGWAGLDTTSGVTGVWVTRKSAFASSPVTTTPSVLPASTVPR